MEKLGGTKTFLDSVKNVNYKRNPRSGTTRNPMANLGVKRAYLILDVDGGLRVLVCEQLASGVFADGENVRNALACVINVPIGKMIYIVLGALPNKT